VSEMNPHELNAAIEEYFADGNVSATLDTHTPGLALPGPTRRLTSVRPSESSSLVHHIHFTSVDAQSPSSTTMPHLLATSKLIAMLSSESRKRQR
jgi:hypothetical protein